MSTPPELREKVGLRDNLPKIPTPQLLEELRQTLYGNELTKEKYFPPEKHTKYLNNFKLFDRNYDDLLDYEELKEFLISIGQPIPEADLEDFYKHLKQEAPLTGDINSVPGGRHEYGITLDNIYLIISKKMREENVEEQLTAAFKIVDDKNQGFVDSEYFKELLMTMGYRWSEEDADEFMKNFDPKNDGKFNPADVIKKLIKR